jgi:hypothetical protein
MQEIYDFFIGLWRAGYFNRGASLVSPISWYTHRGDICGFSPIFEIPSEEMVGFSNPNTVHVFAWSYS